MELSVWVTYFITTIVLSLSPGPGVFSSISSGLNHGFRLGLWNGVGMQVANLLMVVVVALGLGTILIASETLFTAVKWLGVAYLIYLGIVTWRAVPRAFEEDKDDKAQTVREVFMRGFWVNATNPKGIIFFAAILPQFIDMARPQLQQYAILAATTFAVDIVIMMGYTALAAKVLRVMREPRHLRWVNRGIGGAFVAAGLALASFRRVVSITAP
jgi:homoserine/homoserine lactone efflux protein